MKLVNTAASFPSVAVVVYSQGGGTEHHQAAGRRHPWYVDYRSVPVDVLRRQRQTTSESLRLGQATPIPSPPIMLSSVEAARTDRLIGGRGQTGQQDILIGGNAGTGDAAKAGRRRRHRDRRHDRLTDNNAGRSRRHLSRGPATDNRLRHSSKRIGPAA